MVNVLKRFLLPASVKPILHGLIHGLDALFSCVIPIILLIIFRITIFLHIVEVFVKGVDVDTVVLMAARASRIENQDAIDAAIVGMLADPKEARANIREVHFLPFNPTDKRTALTYIDLEGKMHRVSKGAPEQILNLVHNKSELERKVHVMIDKYAERGLISLAVAYQVMLVILSCLVYIVCYVLYGYLFASFYNYEQEVPEGRKESLGGPWQFIALVPLFDPPRHDSVETIQRALNLGVNVKMITGDQLAIAKETGRHLGMGTNMYPSSALLGQKKDESVAGLLLCLFIVFGLCCSFVIIIDIGGQCKNMKGYICWDVFSWFPCVSVGSHIELVWVLEKGM